MQNIDQNDLEPDSYYWVRRADVPLDEGDIEIVQVSTVFGTSREHLSIAVIGTDQHYSLTSFIYLGKVVPLGAGEAQAVCQMEGS